MFTYTPKEDQILRERSRGEAIQARQETIDLASSITFVTLAETGAIDEVTATEHSGLFSPWVSGIDYPIGSLRKHEELLYKCVQAHKSQEDWTPDKTPALWSKAGDPAEEYPAWAQPVGAHDAYTKNDKVTHKDKKWTSTADNNVWEPGVYGWKEA